MNKTVIWIVGGLVVLVGGGITAFFLMKKKKVVLPKSAYEIVPQKDKAADKAAAEKAASDKAAADSAAAKAKSDADAAAKLLLRAPIFKSETTKYLGTGGTAVANRDRIIGSTGKFGAQEALRLGYYLPLTMNRFDVPDVWLGDQAILDWMYGIVHVFKWTGWQYYNEMSIPDSKMKELADGAAHQVMENLKKGNTL